ncbi:hypothetical protein [Idiomarina xiamenensis]|uniref:HEPN domain-containing protein n=1 Tax=Idiomarina xiamenensis 10-D-4 TaxID=740709 RepID=K2J986_9GAMM|nr:hypothetical protein [Idiomarina xiamenensis]EKE79726.1 hypothetical protein A10D4_12739 [Idiomarina xiamenensis 10-D-4]
MSVNAEDFYNSARLNYQQKDEMGFRNCVSRAYYASYHQTLSILTAKIPSYSGKGVHSCLITYLLELKHEYEPYDSRKLNQIGYILKQQKDNRCDADYELNGETIDCVAAEQALSSFDRVAALCAKLEQAA